MKSGSTALGGGAARDSSQASDWVESAARAGYAAKAGVYAVIGVLALQQALGRGGGTTGSGGALERIAAGPFGQILVGLLAVGLAGYVVWRLVQAFRDPEADYADDDGKRLAKRGFYFLSAVLYGALAWQAAGLLLGGSGGGGGDTQETLAARLMEHSWGVWALAAIGVGVGLRGIAQFVKAYRKSFKEKISSFDLGPARRSWVIAASRLGLTARGVIFALIGSFLIRAAATHDPQEAGGLEQALDTLAGSAWVLGAIGAGLVCYAIYQLVKARYRLIGA